MYDIAPYIEMQAEGKKLKRDIAELKAKIEKQKLKIMKLKDRIKKKEKLMRKVVLSLLALLLTSSAYAGIITIDTLTSDATVTYAWFNGAMDAIKNEVNGDLSSQNMADGALKDADFAVAVRPSNTLNETIGSFTYTGMLPPTSASLTAITTAGTSYVEGYRVVTDATSKTYTASKDTYVYIDKNGAFQYSEVANGAAAPTTPANSLLLAKVVTSGAAVTSVTDLRQTTPPNLRTYQNYKSGCIISRDTTTATKINIEAGEIEFGTSVTAGRRRNTGATTIDFTSTGRGGLDTGTQAAATYYYIFALADDGNATGFEGIASTSSTDATGVTGERLVGWTYAASTTVLSPDSTGAYRGLGGDAPNIAKNVVSGDVTVDDTSFSTDLDGTTTRFYSSGRPCRIIGNLRYSPSGGGNNIHLVINIDGMTKYETESTVDTEGAGVEGSCMSQWVGALSAGVHTIKLQAFGDGTNVVKNTYLVIEEL